MRIAVFGASGAIGRRVVEEAVARGHRVAVLVRDSGRLPSSLELDVVVGELTDREAVDGVVSGSDAVIWAVGPTSDRADQPAFFESAARVLVEAMRGAGVRRLVALSGAGVRLPGERKPPVDRLVSAVVARLVPHVVEAKRREYEVFAASDLDWTLVRPPRVVEGGVTGRRVAAERLGGMRVTQGDLADFIVAQLEDETYLRAAPYVSSR